MDQIIFASLSHTHYWYEVGMLEVLAVLQSGIIVLYYYCTTTVNTNERADAVLCAFGSIRPQIIYLVSN